MITYQPHDTVQTWYIIFDKPRLHRRWWHFFLHPKFTHCFALSEASTGFIRFEPLAYGITCFYQDEPLKDFIIKLAESDTTAILQVTVDYRNNTQVIHRGVYNCVTALKALLVLRKPLIFTPFQLYKYLVKCHTCNVIKPWVPYV